MRVSKPTIKIKNSRMRITGNRDLEEKYITRLDSIDINGKPVENIKRAKFLLNVISESGLEDNLSYNILSNGV